MTAFLRHWAYELVLLAACLGVGMAITFWISRLPEPTTQGTTIVVADGEGTAQLNGVPFLLHFEDETIGGDRALERWVCDIRPEPNAEGVEADCKEPGRE